MLPVKFSHCGLRRRLFWAVLREQFIVAKLNDAPFKKALSLVDFDEKQSRT
jgi:hypothetical protein